MIQIDRDTSRSPTHARTASKLNRISHTQHDTMASRSFGRELFDNLPPPSECLAILVGCAETIMFGLGGLNDQVAWAKSFGVPIDAPKDTQDPAENQKTKKALVQAIAARNIQNGALILTFACYTRDRTALGIAVGYGVITTLADYIIVKNSGVPDLAPGHAIGIMNSLLIGGSLLYWRRDDPWW